LAKRDFGKRDLKRKTKPVTIPDMSTQYLDDRAKELRQGKNIFCRSEIAKALREVKYRHDHEMYGAASKAIEDLEFLVSRIPACNPKPALKQGPPHKRDSK
jgi:hypothetical protein